jgi:hypothetical protein
MTAVNQFERTCEIALADAFRIGALAVSDRPASIAGLAKKLSRGLLSNCFSPASSSFAEYGAHVAGERRLELLDHDRPLGT